MKLAAVHAGDVVAFTGQGVTRLGEVRSKQPGALTVAPWLTVCDRSRIWVHVPARRVFAHHPSRARPSTAAIGDLVLVDIRGRQFHARVLSRPEPRELRVEPITPGINYFRARPRDVRARWAANHAPTARRRHEERRDG